MGTKVGGTGDGGEQEEDEDAGASLSMEAEQPSCAPRRLPFVSNRNANF